jgi:hypothetical protein
VTKLDAIDATPLGGISRGYFAANAAVLLDIDAALKGTPASQRPRLARINKKYWLMRR